MIDETLLDQLADYAAGLLDREAAERVERLLAADPALAALAAELGAAQARVEASLADAGRDAPGVPPEVAARLDAALAAELAAPTGRPPEPANRDHAAAHRPDGPLPTGPGSRGPSSARPGASSSRPGGRRPGGRSRWRRGALAGGGVLAAVALVVGGFLGLRQSTVDQSTTSSSGAADSAKAPAFAGPGSLVIRHTNSDYTIDTLPTGPNGVGQAGAQGNARDLEGLARLNDPAALDTCLAAVVAAHPGTVEIVEYARFEGSPALIVLVADAAGTRTVVAGPDCGLPGRGDDEVYVTPAR